MHFGNICPASHRLILLNIFFFFINRLIYVIVCAVVQRTSTVTSGTGTTTSALLVWNTMTWSTLWPSAQQTRSCCYLPATTPPLKCGARHVWCASMRHSSAPHGLANCSPPCLATEVLIWMVNPDLDPGGQDTPWAEGHVWGQETEDSTVVSMRRTRICAFLCGHFAGCAVTNR